MIGIITEVKMLEEFLDIPKKKQYSFIKGYKVGCEKQQVLTVKSILA